VWCAWRRVLAVDGVVALSRRGPRCPFGKHVLLALSAGQIVLAHGAEEDADGEADQKVPGRV